MLCEAGLASCTRVAGPILALHVVATTIQNPIFFSFLPRINSEVLIDDGPGVEKSLAWHEEERQEAIESKKSRRIDENPKRKEARFLGS